MEYYNLLIIAAVLTIYDISSTKVPLKATLAI